MAIPGTDSVNGQGVRTIYAGDVVAKLVDFNTITQGLGIDSAGRVTIKLDDGNGNVVTSQLNGVQRALDVGINVSGVQIDPRLTGQYSSTLPVLTSGSFTALQTNSSGILLTADAADLLPATQSITVVDSASTNTTNFAGQVWYAGTPTAGSVASFTLSSEETVMLMISGTWTGTLQSEISVDEGTTWIAHAIHDISSPIFTSSFTANVVGSLNVAAKTNYRIRATSTVTGSATIRIVESLNASSVYIANAVKLVDGSSPTSTTTMTIKAASTAAAATDTSIVVGFSPNSPLPSGQTGVIGAVNQGTAPWVTSDLADGPVAPGTAAAKSLLGGAVYNSSAPTLTAGQQASLQSDVNGNLKVDLATSIPAGTALIGATNLYVNGATNSATNPAFVTLTSSLPGNPVNNYYVSPTNLAYGASDTHVYTITTGKTFSGKKFFASASGRIRIDVQTVIGGTTATVFTAFSSTSDPNISIDMDEFAVTDSGAGAIIQIVRYNEEFGATFAAFSTISGTET